MERVSGFIPDIDQNSIFFDFNVLRSMKLESEISNEVINIEWYSSYKADYGVIIKLKEIYWNSNKIKMAAEIEIWQPFRYQNFKWLLAPFQRWL